MDICGVSAVAQWVKNLIAVAQVAVKVQVRSLAQCSGLKDPVLLAGNFHMPRVDH